VQKVFCNNICYDRTHAPQQKWHLDSITSSGCDSFCNNTRFAAVISLDRAIARFRISAE
jgi:hypothetical protein